MDLSSFGYSQLFPSQYIALSALKVESLDGKFAFQGVMGGFQSQLQNVIGDRFFLVLFQMQAERLPGWRKTWVL